MFDFRRGLRGQGGAVDQDLALCRLGEAAHQAHEHGFAFAVGPGDGDEFTPGD